MERLELFTHSAMEGLRHQQARADAAKVAASLLAAVGPAIAAASLASGVDHTAWRRVTVVALVVIVAAAVAVFLLDRRVGVDPVAQVAASTGVSNNQIERDQLTELLDAYTVNRTAIRNTYAALYAEMAAVAVLTVAACFLLPGSA